MPRGGYFQGPLGPRLAPYVGEIRIGNGRLRLGDRRDHGDQFFFSPKKGDHVAQAFGPPGFAPLHQGDFVSVVRRHEEGNSRIPGENGRADGPADAPEAPVQGQLAEKNCPWDLRNASHGSGDAEGDWKVQDGSLFRQVRRGEVHRNPPPDGKTEGPEGRPHPLLGLPDRRIGQADNGDGEQAPGDFRLHLHPQGLHALQGNAPDGIHVRYAPAVTSSNRSTDASLPG
ncbi:hypothetical protein SDC9_38140 [bioreactor metagenome]|uniref:Uncharacterized protein n=1 Tax=bioreactor metagenome TaxID=1076179 RepID=A0A644VKW8_9ZZZZ